MICSERPMKKYLSQRVNKGGGIYIKTRRIRILQKYQLTKKQGKIFITTLLLILFISSIGGAA
jgi:hypothetical protein